MVRMRDLDGLLARLLVLGVAVAAFFLGVIATTFWFARPRPMTVRPDERAGVAVVQIDALEDGVVVGSMSGAVRVMGGGEAVLPDAQGKFRIRGLSRQAAAPEGMRFVASRRGKKYYPVGSTSAAHLSPANRVYFPDEAAAQAAGFVK